MTRIQNRFYPTIKVSGGDPGAVDAIDGDDLITGDTTLTVDDNSEVSFYRCNTTGGEVENLPVVVVPDENPGNINWDLVHGVLIGLTLYNDPTAGGHVGNRDYNDARYAAISDLDDYTPREEWLQNGFINAADVSFSWDDSTQTLTIEPAVTSYDYHILGVKYTETETLTKQITADETGLWVFYFSAEGVISCVKNPSHSQIDTVINNYCIIAYAYWNTTVGFDDGRLMYELHGSNMSPATHHWIHDNMGAQFAHGMSLADFVIDQNGNDAEDAQFSIAAGEFYDEDIEIELDEVGSTIGVEIWFLNGSDWEWVTVAGYSVISSGGDLQYNDSGSQTAVGNNDFVLCHIFATNITDDAGANPKYIAIQGQEDYGTIIQARAGADEEINSLVYGDLPLQEIVPVGTVIFQNKGSTGYGATRTTTSGDNFVDWRQSNLKGSGGSVSDHGSLAGLSDDDHSQYLLADGTRALAGDMSAGGNSITDHAQAITDNAIVTMDSADAASGEYAKFTAAGLESKTFAEVRSDINVEDGADVTDASSVDAAGAVMETDYNAQTILASILDNTPTAIAFAEQTIAGRVTGGDVDALSVAEVITLLNTGTGLDADTLDGYDSSASATGNTIVLRQAAGHIVGAQIYGTDVNMSHAQTTRSSDTVFFSSLDAFIRKNTKTGMLASLNVEDGADVTDASSVDAAGAVMESDYGVQEVLASILDNTPVAIAFAASTIMGRTAAGDIDALSVAEVITLLNTGSGLDADTLDGYDSDENATGDTICLRNSSGDVRSRYTIMSHSPATASSDTVFYSSTDNFIRKNTKTGMLASLNVADGADVTGDNAPQAHKDSHDPEDGSDALDCAAPLEISVVVAAGEGSAHSFARSDHVHAITHGITDNHLVTVDDAGGGVNGEFPKWTANGLQSRSVAEMQSDLGIGGGQPIGVSVKWHTTTPPTGYLEEDGSGLSTTTYSDLFAVLGYQFGGSGGTFNLRDSRGEFDRNWDHGAGVDPDAASRTDRGDGTSGDNPGTTQPDDYLAHLHTGRFVNANIPLSGSAAAGYHFCKSTANSNSSTAPATGGNETRPVNRYVMSIIKY